MNWRVALNVGIVLAIAAIVVVVPGGGTAASVLTQVVTLAFLAAIAWFARIMYRQQRFALDALGDRRRALFYIAIGAAALTLTATSRLWASPGGSVAWLLIMGACVYAVIAIVLAARRG